MNHSQETLGTNGVGGKRGVFCSYGSAKGLRAQRSHTGRDGATATLR